MKIISGQCFLGFLRVPVNKVRKHTLFKNSFSCPGNPHFVRVQCKIKLKIFLFKIGLVGTLNLCLEQPDTMQKKSVKTDHTVQRKRPKHARKWLFYAMSIIFWHVLDVFSAPGCRIELIPFALGQATQGTSLEYPQGLF